MTKTADPASVPETGSDVEFTFLVENVGVEDVTLTSLTDTVFGDLDGQGSCLTGGSIPVAGSYSCSITESLAADDLVDHVNVVTAVAVDDDGASDTDSDGATVSFTDVAPSVSLVKSALPTIRLEPGGDFVFTLEVTNTSVESVTITELTDTQSVFFSQGCIDLVDTVLEPDVSVSCSYTVPHANAGVYVNTASVTVEDNDGSEDSDTAEETVTVLDVDPDIVVTKTADPASVPETGGDVEFTFLVENVGVEDVTLTSLTDTVFGDLDGQGSCLTGGSIPVAGSYSCSLTVFLASDDLSAHSNVVTAIGADDDGNTDTDFDGELVSFTNVDPDIVVTKTADPASVPETGSDVEFTFLVENVGVEDVTLTSLTDTVFGDLDGQGSCLTGGSIPVAGSYSCSITESLAADDLVDHVNVVTAVAVDDDGASDTDSDGATVSFTDVAPSVSLVKSALPTIRLEPGGDFVFTLEVTNTSVESVTITELTDTQSVFFSQGCIDLVDTVLEPDVSVSCSYAVPHANAGVYVNTASVTVEDNDGSEDSDTAEETVTVLDVDPDIVVTKTADPASVPETGSDVEFTFLVENVGVEDVTLTSLTDTVFGDLDGQGSCLTGGSIPIAGSYSCSLTVFLASDDLSAHSNVVTAIGADDDGNTDTDFDGELVSFTNVDPDIVVTKTADPASVPETGSDVEFTFLVENVGVEDVTLTSLTDTVFGDLDGQGSCLTGGSIPVAGSYSCSITESLAADDLVDHVNVVTAVAVDDDGASDTDSDGATVSFTDVAPSVSLVKSALPTIRLEPGGDFVFTLEVTNTSVESVTITELTDTQSVFFSQDCIDLVDTVLEPDVSVSCSYTVPHANAGVYVNTASVTVEDNDGSEDSDTAEETVTVLDVDPDIVVTKTADPASVPETGSDVEFTFLVENVGVEDVTLTSLTDTVFGDLDGQGSCLTGGSIPVAGSYSCSITESLAADDLVDHVNVVTAVAVDDDGASDTDSDGATVSFTDVAPSVSLVKSALPIELPESGGPATFTLGITNNSAFESVTVTGLVDNRFGNLIGSDAGLIGGATATSCNESLPITIDAGATFECTIEAALAGDAGDTHTNTATVTATDGDPGSTPVTASDDATVTFTDEVPEIVVTKVANPTSVPESGGPVVYTVDIENPSFETVTVTDLVDNRFGNLIGSEAGLIGGATATSCNDSLPITIAAGTTVTCTIDSTLSGHEGDAHTNTVTVTATDGDPGSTPVSNSDSATVSFTDVPPTVTLDKSASPTTLPEPGGDFDFTLDVTNTSFEEVTITALTDTQSAFFSQDCTDLVGTTLAPDATASCSYTVPHTNAGSYDNTASVTVADDEGTTATDTAEATVTVTDVAPTVTLGKSALPTTLPEPGGDFVFTLDVTNTSFEAVTITALTDTQSAFFSQDCTDLVGTTLVPDCDRVMLVHGATHQRRIV